MIKYLTHERRLKSANFFIYIVYKGKYIGDINLKKKKIFDKNHHAEQI